MLDPDAMSPPDPVRASSAPRRWWHRRFDEAEGEVLVVARRGQKKLVVAERSLSFEYSLGPLRAKRVSYSYDDVTAVALRASNKSFLVGLGRRITLWFTLTEVCVEIDGRLRSWINFFRVDDLDALHEALEGREDVHVVREHLGDATQG